MRKTRRILKKFSNKCMNYLNSIKIPSRIGKHQLELSSRTLSDVIEKHTIDFMIDFFGEENVKYGNWSGYDVIIINIEKEIIYVNIKTNVVNPNMDGTWLCSASVIDILKKKDILNHLYCVKFEYIKDNKYLEFTSGKVAGPIADIELVYHTKGDKAKYRIRTEYNGTHCHILNKCYK